MCRFLVDSRATHSYVSMNVIDKLSMPYKLFEHNFGTMLPSGDMMLPNKWLASTPVIVEDRECPADLIELSIPNYDVILGMDWLSKHGATIYYRKKTVGFRPKEEEVIPLEEKYQFLDTRNIYTGSTEYDATWLFGVPG
ncbi:uncharacterized protein LOC133791961 [Humulus lupulus]|uniref:uncharacterized protein LOC133791961 n=1 Tax=Humulus lupulus TaxID=3486 RepID=UPI002B4163C7|nr:uncharacterized protein LOC133791961 [Humulus lupulus]